MNVWAAGAAGALLLGTGALGLGIGALALGIGALALGIGALLAGVLATDPFWPGVAVVDEGVDTVCADPDGVAGAAALVSVGPPPAVDALAGVEGAADCVEVAADESGEEDAAPTAGSLLGTTAGAGAGGCASAETLPCDCDCAMLTPAVEAPTMVNPVSIAHAYPRLLVFISSP